LTRVILLALYCSVGAQGSAPDAAEPLFRATISRSTTTETLLHPAYCMSPASVYVGVNSAPSFTSANTTPVVSTTGTEPLLAYLPSSTAIQQHNATSNAPCALHSDISMSIPMISSQETEGTALHNGTSDVPPVNNRSDVSPHPGITFGPMVTSQETGAATSQPSGSSVFNMSESLPVFFSSSFLDISYASSRFMVFRISNSESKTDISGTSFPDLASSLNSTNSDLGSFVSATLFGSLFTSPILFGDIYFPIGTFSPSFSLGAFFRSCQPIRMSKSKTNPNVFHCAFSSSLPVAGSSVFNDESVSYDFSLVSIPLSSVKNISHEFSVDAIFSVAARMKHLKRTYCFIIADWTDSMLVVGRGSPICFRSFFSYLRDDDVLGACAISWVCNFSIPTDVKLLDLELSVQSLTIKVDCPVVLVESQDSVCIDNPTRALAFLKNKSVANFKVQYLPSDESGPTEPKLFTDDFVLYFSKFELIFLEPKLALGYMVCNCFPNDNNVPAELNVFDGIAAIRIPPPKVSLRTHFVCLVHLSDSQPQYAHGVKFSFAVDVFDDLHPESTACESEEHVTLLVSSSSIGSAVVAFDPKVVPACSVSIANYLDYGDVVVTARLPIFTRYSKRPRVCRIALRQSCRVLHHFVFSLQCFPLVTQSNEFICSVSSASTGSVQLISASSTVTFIQIGIDPFGGSTNFHRIILYAVVTVTGNDDSASFGFIVLSSPAFDVLTETLFQISFSAFRLDMFALSCSFYVYDLHNSSVENRFRAAQTRFFLPAVGLNHQIASAHTALCSLHGPLLPISFFVSSGVFIPLFVCMEFARTNVPFVWSTTPILLPRNTLSSILASVKPENADTSKNQSTIGFRREPLVSLFQLTIITAMVSAVYPAIADLWHHVWDLALVAIMIFAAFAARKVVLGSVVASLCHRKCTTSNHQYLNVSSGMQDPSLFMRQLEISRLCACVYSRFMHQSQIKKDAASHRRVTSCRGTLPSLMGHISTIARNDLCALFALIAIAVKVVVMTSLLSLPITTAQTCANHMLGDGRFDLAAASLPSGLVLFAGGMSGV